MALNAARHVVPPLGQLAMAWLVVQRAGDGAWGAVVGPLLVASILAQIIAWGSKDFLLREFAQRPRTAVSPWCGNLLARAVFLAPALLLMVAVSTAAAEWALWSLWMVARFVATSFDPLVLAERRMVPAVLAEVSAVAAAMGTLLAAPAPLGSTWVLVALAAGSSVRAVVLAAAFVGRLDLPSRLTAHWGSLTGSLPFVLTGLAGTMASKADLWLVAASQADALVGRYHIITNALLALQATTALAMAPFARGLYRLPDDALRRLSWCLLALGLPVSALGVGAVALVMRSAFGFPFEWSWFAVGAAFVLPMFATAPRIHLLLKQHRESTVAVVAFAAGLVNAALTWLALPRFGLQGALAASAIASWAQLIAAAWMTRSVAALVPRANAGVGNEDAIDFLEHLATRGAASIHAQGRRGTTGLLRWLEVPEGSPVLDIGCGTGETLVRLASRGAFGIGVDVSLVGLRRARDRARWCRFHRRTGYVNADVGVVLPFADATFDTVVIESVLAVLNPDERRRVLAEIRRVLRPHGRALINETVWRVGVPLSEAEHLNRETERLLGWPQACVDPFARDDWVEVFGAAGFAVEDTASTDGAPRYAGRWSDVVTIVQSRVATLIFRIQAFLGSGYGARDRRVAARLGELPVRGGMLEGVCFVLRRRDGPVSDHPD
jgi:SAM-dependent methyltransferase